MTKGERDTHRRQRKRIKNSQETDLETDRQRQRTREQKTTQKGMAAGLMGHRGAGGSESPLCSRAALRGFLHGRGKVVGECAQPPCGP